MWSVSLLITNCGTIGTVAWYRHPRSEEVLREWWDASMDPYETNPIKRYE